MAKPIIQVPVVFDSASRRKDMSVSIRLSTYEAISSEQFLVMDQMINEPGWMQFVPRGEQLPEVPKEHLPESGLKSQSQRLRAVLFLMWKADGEPGHFENYYRDKTEWIIGRLKAKLPELV